jgi:hypothetical protein
LRIWLIFSKRNIGKPGGGAPKLDPNSGQLKTKIVGTLQWNLSNT